MNLQHFKVIQGHQFFGINRKGICDFLFVRHGNLNHILHRFGDTAIRLKIAYFSYPSLTRRPRCPCCLWNFTLKLIVSKLDSWGYLWRKLH